MNLRPGDPAPIFTAASTSSEHYHFATAAGRYLLLCFFGSAAGETEQQLLAGYRAHPIFDDARASFFGISRDAEDADRLTARLPGIRFIWDSDAKVHSLYGLAEANRRVSILLDPLLRVVAVIPFTTPEEQLARFDAIARRLPPLERYAGVPVTAPVLLLPRVLEPALCRELIAHYDKIGGVTSGFMREVDGQTVGMRDVNFKRRADVTIEDEKLRVITSQRIATRIFPEIFKAFQFRCSRVERYLVARYGSEDQGFFRAHRDNTTKGTAHRKFAVTINLNAEDYEGGNLRFPEFGPQTYRAPTGGAVIFSCSLLHEATPVTQGARYAFLPFLFDEEGAKIREQNQSFLSDRMIDLNAPEE